MRESMLVIGVGNEMRGDDGAGVAVARRVAARALPGVDVVEATGEGAALMDAWEGAERVVVVDAAQAGGEPGTIYRFDTRRDALPTRFFHYSTHAFSVAEAVELARALGRLPSALVVYGIEGARYEAGAGLSPAVDEAADRVAARIVEELTAAAP